LRELMCALVCATQAGVLAEVKLAEVKLAEVKLAEVKLAEVKLAEVKLAEVKLVGQRPHQPRVRELQPRLFNLVAVWLQ